MWFGPSSSPVLPLILATTTKQPSQEEGVFVTKYSFVVYVIICFRLIVINVREFTEAVVCQSLLYLNFTTLTLPQGSTNWAVFRDLKAQLINQWQPH